MEKNELRKAVLAAFAEVTRPAPDDIAPHQCEECDQLTRHLLPFAPTDVPDEVFQAHVWDMALLSANAKQFYLPAWLLRAAASDGLWTDAGDALVAALETDHRWDPSTPYTEDQWFAVDAVLTSMSASADPITVERAELARSRLPK